MTNILVLRDLNRPLQVWMFLIQSAWGGVLWLLLYGGIRLQLSYVHLELYDQQPPNLLGCDGAKRNDAGCSTRVSSAANAIANIYTYMRHAPSCIVGKNAAHRPLDGVLRAAAAQDPPIAVATAGRAATTRPQPHHASVKPSSGPRPEDRLGRLAACACALAAGEWPRVSCVSGPARATSCARGLAVLRPWLELASEDSAASCLSLRGASSICRGRGFQWLAFGRARLGARAAFGLWKKISLLGGCGGEGTLSNIICINVCSALTDALLTRRGTRLASTLMAPVSKGLSPSSAGRCSPQLACALAGKPSKVKGRAARRSRVVKWGSRAHLLWHCFQVVFTTWRML